MSYPILRYLHQLVVLHLHGQRGSPPEVRLVLLASIEVAPALEIQLPILLVLFFQETVVLVDAVAVAVLQDLEQRFLFIQYVFVLSDCGVRLLWR